MNHAEKFIKKSGLGDLRGVNICGPSRAHHEHWRLYFGVAAILEDYDGRCEGGDTAPVMADKLRRLIGVE